MDSLGMAFQVSCLLLPILRSGLLLLSYCLTVQVRTHTLHALLYNFNLILINNIYSKYYYKY